MSESEGTFANLSPENSEDSATIADRVRLNNNSAQELNERLQRTIQTTDALINKYKAQIKTLKEKAANMSIELKDIISAIPVFSGEKKELETFINTCDLYVELIDQKDLPNLLKIIKTKITSEALAKISPVSTLNSWQEIKKKLKEKIQRRVTIEFAKEDLDNVSQKREETIEQYGGRIRSKLRILNEAIKDMTSDENEIAILRKLNERQAVSKFEQNIRENTLKILVSAAAKGSLDESIAFAIQKELTLKIKPNPFKKCANCGMTNHETENCRKSKDFKNGDRKNYDKDKNSYKSKFNNKYTGANSSSGSGKNNSFTNKNNNTSKIKSMHNFEEMTIQEALDQEETEYQINNYRVFNTARKTSIMPISLQNNELIMEIPTLVTHQKLKFCIDTGAQISVIKPQKILNAKIDIFK